MRYFLIFISTSRNSLVSIAGGVQGYVSKTYPNINEVFIDIADLYKIKSEDIVISNIQEVSKADYESAF